MAFAMAAMHEDKGLYVIAIKFIKRLFFCAKLLEDFEGAEIALNKIGICYFLNHDAAQSLVFHKKHYELSFQMKHDNNKSQIISLYN